MTTTPPHAPREYSGLPDVTRAVTARRAQALDELAWYREVLNDILPRITSYADWCALVYLARDEPAARHLLWMVNRRNVAHTRTELARWVLAAPTDPESARQQRPHQQRAVS